jgi:hypothetical protein
MNAPTLAIIIPTLGKRLDYLIQALDSALDSPASFILAVSPNEKPEQLETHWDPRCEWLIADRSLPSSLNFAVGQLPAEVSHFMWIGDDDLVVGTGLAEALKHVVGKSLTVGSCEMLDENGVLQYVFRPARWKLNPRVMRVIANPIAQPATIIEVSSFWAISGISEKYPLAFDHDLFFRIMRMKGSPCVVSATFASYRVHSQTLSNLNWEKQFRESAEIRLQGLSNPSLSLVALIDLFRLSALRFVSRVKYSVAHLAPSSSQR